MVYATCIVGGCRDRVASPEISPSGRYCGDHERQLLYEDLAAQGILKGKAWSMAQTEMRRRRFKLERREREKKARAARPKEAKPVRKLAARPKDRNKKRRERENRRLGKCACGRKPRKGLLNCDRCIRRKHPPGKPRSENKKTVAKNQKRHYASYKRKRRCVDCGKKVVFDEGLGRYPSRCLEHRSIDAMNSAARRWGVTKEAIASGQQDRVRGDDLEDTGDLELEDLIMSTEEDVWVDRNPRRNRDARRGSVKATFDD